MLMAALYKGGATVKELAKSYEVSPITVRRRLKAAGVELRKRGAKPKLSAPQVEYARLMVAAKHKREWIAKSLGVCVNTPRKALKA